MKDLILNGLKIEVTPYKVIIHDVMDDVSDAEAKKIMQYLLDEAIIDNEDLLCEIRRSEQY